MALCVRGHNIFIEKEMLFTQQNVGDEILKLKYLCQKEGWLQKHLFDKTGHIYENTIGNKGH